MHVDHGLIGVDVAGVVPVSTSKFLHGDGLIFESICKGVGHVSSLGAVWARVVGLGLEFGGGVKGVVMSGLNLREYRSRSLLKVHYFLDLEIPHFGDHFSELLLFALLSDHVAHTLDLSFQVLDSFINLVDLKHRFLGLNVVLFDCLVDFEGLHLEVIELCQQKLLLVIFFEFAELALYFFAELFDSLVNVFGNFITSLIYYVGLDRVNFVVHIILYLVLELLQCFLRDVVVIVRF